jgi:hypothetical protein
LTKTQTGKRLALASVVMITVAAMGTSAAMWTSDVTPSLASTRAQGSGLIPTPVVSHVRAHRAEPSPDYDYDDESGTQSPEYGPVPLSPCYDDEGYRRLSSCEGGDN